MEYLICIFLPGLIVTFIVVVGLARAAERLEIDPVPPIPPDGESHALGRLAKADQQVSSPSTGLSG